MCVLKVSVHWKNDFQFTAEDLEGHSVEINATQIDGKIRGITPMQLLLIALGGCTAIDVVQILQKQRQEFTALTIDVSGDRRAEEPRYFEKIHVKYALMGRDLDEVKIQRAIRLSKEKYCSVEAMLKSKADITSTYVILKEPHENP